MLFGRNKWNVFNFVNEQRSIKFWYKSRVEIKLIKWINKEFRTVITNVT